MKRDGRYSNAAVSLELIIQQMLIEFHEVYEDSTWSVRACLCTARAVRGGQRLP